MSTATPPRPPKVGTAGNIVGYVVLALISLGFIAAGAFVYLQQHSGEQVTVTVTECEKARRSITCVGTWTQDGETRSGIVDGAHEDDIDRPIEARVHGDRAYTPNLRIPLIFVGLGLLWPIAMLWTLVRRLVSR